MKTPRILIVDDDEQMLKMLRLALHRAGMEVTTAADGGSALRAFVESPPDLALVDIAMPGMDGYDVIERMREIEAEQDVRAEIVILTAHSQPLLRTYGVDLGVRLFLTKPIPPSELVEAIHSVLDGRAR